jgi:lipopolysaccharide export LptBFGC system permease protein LptF
LLPVYLGASLLALGMFVLREEATSGLGRRRDLLQDHLEERRDLPVVENLVVRDLKGRAARLGQYRVARDPEASEFNDLSVLLREDAGTVILTATAGHPLTSGRWALTDGQKIEVDDQERHTHPLPVLEDLRFTPQDVELAWKAREHPMDLSYAELSDLQAREPSNLQYRTLLQYNLTFPLAGLVLLLVGLPFVVGDERGKAGERIARGFLLCVAYFGVDFVARTLGLQGAVGPIFSGWLPLVLFGSLGSVLTAAMRS